jgi:inner membrane protein
MCSAITHAVLGVAVARVGTGARMPLRFWVAAAVLSVAPDIDGLRHTFGAGWDAGMWGHRGVTHSLVSAALTAAAATLVLFPRSLDARAQDPAVLVDRWSSPISKWRVWLILAAAMASHGLTDMLTNGGAGVAEFAPLSVHRYKWAFQPVEVSPMSVGRFIGERGLNILWNELRWVLLPAGAAVAAAELLRARLKRSASP